MDLKEQTVVERVSGRKNLRNEGARKCSIDDALLNQKMPVEGP